MCAITCKHLSSYIKSELAFLCMLPQTFADMEAMGSPVPQLQEEQHSESGRDSPMSNSASANAATNSEFVSHNTELQVCLFSVCVFALLFKMHLSCHNRSC